MAALPGEALPCGFPALKLRPTLKDSRLPFPMSPVFKAALWMAGWLAATVGVLEIANTFNLLKARRA
jgi:hypothetical protein